MNCNGFISGSGLLLVLLSIFVFQNCSEVRNGSASDHSLDAKGNGDVYSGKIYINYLTAGLCEDGTTVNAVIKNNEGAYRLTRSACTDLSTPLGLAETEIRWLSQTELVYYNLDFRALPTPTSSATAASASAASATSSSAANLPRPPAPIGRIDTGIVRGVDCRANAAASPSLNNSHWRLSVDSTGRYSGLVSVVAQDSFGTLVNVNGGVSAQVLQVGSHYLFNLMNPGASDPVQMLSFSLDASVPSQDLMANATVNTGTGLESLLYLPMTCTTF